MTETTVAKPAWWISWFSPEALGGFELHWPWWRSGWYFAQDESEVTIVVAAVRADSEEEAFEIVKQAYYDYPAENLFVQRFAELLPEGQPMPWEREGTRFPLEEWQEWK